MAFQYREALALEAGLQFAVCHRFAEQPALPVLDAAITKKAGLSLGLDALSDHLQPALHKKSIIRDRIPSSAEEGWRAAPGWCC